MNQPTDRMIGRRLRDARKFLRLRQETVATQIGITRQVISYIETGERPVKAIDFKRSAICIE